MQLITTELKVLALNFSSLPSLAYLTKSNFLTLLRALPVKCQSRTISTQTIDGNSVIHWKILLLKGSIPIISNRLVVGQIVDSDYFCDLTQTDGLTALW